MAISLGAQVLLDTFNKRDDFSARFFDEVVHILAEEFIIKADEHDDMFNKIDLIIVGTTIGFRVRQNRYLAYQDFTLRSSSGNDETEYSVIFNNKNPEFFFYAWANKKGDRLISGYLIDLRIWREEIKSGKLKPINRTNPDGSSFVAFPLRESYSRKIL